MLSKSCKQCGTTFYKKVNTSQKEWDNRSKYCSPHCSRLNTTFKKGLIPWSKSQKGIHLSSKSEFKRGQNTGALNNRWKGGISTENSKIRNSYEYKQWRKAVFERDNYTCQECGERGGRIVADHIWPFADFPELRLELGNGQVLCEPCHKLTPSYLQSRGNHNMSNLCTVYSLA